MVMEGGLTQGGELTIQYTEDVLQNCTPEIYITLLTSVTPINVIFLKKQMRVKQKNRKTPNTP